MIERRPALGKGLSALIPDAPEPARAGTIEVDIDLLAPNDKQPRIGPKHRHAKRKGLHASRPGKLIDEALDEEAHFSLRRPTHIACCDRKLGGHALNAHIRNRVGWDCAVEPARSELP